MNYQELKTKKEKDLNEHFTNMGVFWAFSDKQFDENKTPLMEGEKYVSIGGGGYMPKHNVEELLNGTKRIDEEFKQGLEAIKGREEHILYELNNHEAYYTGTIDSTLEALGEDYTSEEVQVVFKKYKAKKYEQETSEDKYLTETGKDIINKHK